jgi:sugar phosphate isomerase/epimerase
MPELAGRSVVLANGSLREASITDMVGAAAGAGFDAIGISLGRYLAVKQEGWTDAGIHSLLDDHGVRLVELEVLRGYFAGANSLSGGGADRRAEAERQTFEIAERFGVRHVQALGSFSEPLGPTAIESFAGLCDRAAQHDVLVALEFMPTTNIPDAAVALSIIQGAGRANGGLCVDTWHHFRGANDDALLRVLPADKVFVIQVNDGAAEPESTDYVHDTTHNRRSPGDGCFDLAGFLRLMNSIDVDAPLSIEVLSESMDALPPNEVAASLARGTRAVMAAAEWGESIA